MPQQDHLIANRRSLSKALFCQVCATERLPRHFIAIRRERSCQAIASALISRLRSCLSIPPSVYPSVRSSRARTIYNSFHRPTIRVCDFFPGCPSALFFPAAANLIHVKRSDDRRRCIKQADKLALNATSINIPYIYRCARFSCDTETTVLRFK